METDPELWSYQMMNYGGPSETGASAEPKFSAVDPHLAGSLFFPKMDEAEAAQDGSPCGQMVCRSVVCLRRACLSERMTAWETQPHGWPPV
mmetsp:Transcript_15328/g.42872  ORF Transcript_15328/g.42872 Transcript_15328/m.42872 type:complete len:91 (+) Transcript_15328:1535-1807(+)